MQKHITFGDCYLLKQDDHFELKAAIAEHFAIHPNEVIIVGSSKLGFSIAPPKRYREFGDKSDIDAAIISERLFDGMWDELFEYERVGAAIWHKRDDFKKYLFRGWMRPDMLPPSYNFQTADDWWEFFRQLTNRQSFGPYRINGALYRTWRHIDAYQEFAVRECQTSMGATS